MSSGHFLLQFCDFHQLWFWVMAFTTIWTCEARNLSRNSLARHLAIGQMASLNLPRFDCKPVGQQVERERLSRGILKAQNHKRFCFLVSRVEILWLEGAEAAGQRNHYQLDLCRQILLGQRKSKSKDCTRRLYKKQRPLQKLLALKSSRHCTRQTGNLLGWYVAITWCRRLQLWDGCFACDGQAVCTGWSVFEVTKMKGLNAS